jgi:hypothetical protein
MKRFNWILCAASIAAVAGIAAPPSRAQYEPEVDLRVATRAPGVEGNLFFSISSQYFHREPQTVSNWSRRFRNPDDLAVFFYIVSRSWSSPEQVYAIRMRGTPWFEVGRQCGVPFNAWYVTYDGRPTGRYSKPYKSYDRYRQDPRYSARLSDNQIRDLVAVRMAHEYYGVPAQTAMDWRRDGASVQVIMTREYQHHRRDRDPQYSQYDERDRRYFNDNRPDDHQRNDNQRNDR